MSFPKTCTPEVSSHERRPHKVSPLKRRFIEPSAIQEHASKVRSLEVDPPKIKPLLGRFVFGASITQHRQHGLDVRSYGFIRYIEVLLRLRTKAQSTCMMGQ